MDRLPSLYPQRPIPSSASLRRRMRRVEGRTESGRRCGLQGTSTRTQQRSYPQTQRQPPRRSITYAGLAGDVLGKVVEPLPPEHLDVLPPVHPQVGVHLLQRGDDLALKVGLEAPLPLPQRPRVVCGVSSALRGGGEREGGVRGPMFSIESIRRRFLDPSAMALVMKVVLGRTPPGCEQVHKRISTGSGRLDEAVGRTKMNLRIKSTSLSVVSSRQ